MIACIFYAAFAHVAWILCAEKHFLDLHYSHFCILNQLCVL